MAKEKIRLNDSNTGKKLIVQTITESLDKNVEVILPLNGKLITIDTMLEHISGIMKDISNIKKPIITYPTNNEIDFDGSITMSSYLTSDLFVGEHTNTVIQVARDVEFTDLVINTRLTGVESYLPTALKSLTTYYIRVMYVSNDMESMWSDVVKFTTKFIKIDTPTITISRDDVNNVDDGAIFTSSDFVSIDTNEDHVSTTWWLVDGVTNEVIWESVDNTSKLLKIIIPRGILEVSKDYIVKVIFKGNINGSSSEGMLLFKTRSKFTYVGDDLNQNVISRYGDVEYFGEVGINQLDGTYNYRGEWGVNSGRPDKDYIVDEQVTYNDVLYRCIKTHTNIEPGTDETTWVVDVRNNIPTGKWILDHIGIGYGLTDNNADTRSSGSVKLGNLKNNDQGWLKYVYNDKLIYIAKKPFVDTIAWTDIAKRSAVSGDEIGYKRTIRIGKHLYYIDLVNEARYNECLVNVTNGMLDTLSITDVSLNEKCWLNTTINSNGYQSMSNGNNIEAVDAKSRTGSYRPILIYIPEGEEPYNNIPSSIPTATNENFQYDFYTDTGYFGHVPSTSLIGSTALATTAGLTAGTAQNDTTGYFKFYWHGQILYVCKQVIRYSISWDQINSANCVFGIRLGEKDRKTITVGSNTYAVQLLLGGGTSPTNDVGFYLADSEANFKIAVDKDVCRGSQWNDLMYRVHVTVPSNKYSGQDNTASGQLAYTGGVQTGKNWASYGDAEMSISSVGGTGTAALCQEVSTYSTGTRTCRGRYRSTHLFYRTSTSTASTYGTRLALRLL